MINRSNHSPLQEVWKDIPKYKGYYQVSSLGNVRSLIQWNGHRYIKRNKPYILSQSNTTTGYKKVELVKDGVIKSKKVHRLVAKAFIPRIKGKNIINHKDGNPKNNHVDNLEWCTQSENMQHAYDVGLMKRKICENKEKLIIKDYLSKIRLEEIADKYGIEKNSIYRVLKKNNIKTQGNEIRHNKYNINKPTLIKMFEANMRNIDIAKHYGCPSSLIGVYKYNLKKEGKI